MPSFCASAAAADASLAVLPLLPVALEPDELELDAPEVPAVVLPDELLPAVETLEVPVLVLALSVEVPPQALKQRQAATAAARSSERCPG
jgi:hypothetical protein